MCPERKFLTLWLICIVVALNEMSKPSKLQGERSQRKSVRNDELPTGNMFINDTLLMIPNILRTFRVGFCLSITHLTRNVLPQQYLTKAQDMWTTQPRGNELKYWGSEDLTSHMNIAILQGRWFCLKLFMKKKLRFVLLYSIFNYQQMMGCILLFLIVNGRLTVTLNISSKKVWGGIKVGDIFPAIFSLLCFHNVLQNLALH